MSENIIDTDLDTAQVYPTVAFDVKLGKSVDYIDFNYEAFYEHMKASGISDGQVKNSRINVKPDSAARSIKGSVDLDTGELMVRASSKANKAFIHETQHLIDYYNSPPTSRQKKFTRMHNTGLFYGGAIFLSEGIISGPVLHQSEVVSNALLIAAPAVMAVSALAYVCSTAERRARHAAKTIDAQFLTVTKKS